MNKKMIKPWIWLSVFCLLIVFLSPYKAQAFFVKPQIAAGDYHTVGLRSDGTVAATGKNDKGQCNVGSWTNIIQITAGNEHTVGLKSDGTVVSTGFATKFPYDNRYDVGGWTDIVQVDAGDYHTLGLKSDGTCVAVGYTGGGATSVGPSYGFSDIIQISAGHLSSFGLKSNGTVVAKGYFEYDQGDVGSWTNIVQISAGGFHTLGLKPNGTVVATGKVDGGRLNVSGWTNIIQVDASSNLSLGSRSNGRVLITGRCFNYPVYNCSGVGNWTDILQAVAGVVHTLGLKGDGTVVATGRNNYGQCNVQGWHLNTVYYDGYDDGYQDGVDNGYQEAQEECTQIISELNQTIANLEATVGELQANADSQKELMESVITTMFGNKATIEIADVSRGVVQKAINDAINQGGKSRYISKAQKEMDRAFEDYNRGQYKKTIAHYKKAWIYSKKTFGKNIKK